VVSADHAAPDRADPGDPAVGGYSMIKFFVLDVLPS
jgi:hypothetical protein